MTAVLEIPLARMCVCVCICVHNLTSMSGDLIPGQFSAGCIRRPVGNYSLESSTGQQGGEANALSLTRGRWSLIDNQIFFSHAYYFCSTGWFYEGRIRALNWHNSTNIPRKFRLFWIWRGSIYFGHILCICMLLYNSEGFNLENP